MPQPSQQAWWHTHLSIDTLLLVLSHTFFHPFIAFLLPLSLRALATPYSHPSFILTTAYFLLISLYHILSTLSARVASNGPPRPVGGSENDGEEPEVVVITGGGRGLGRCVAEILAMRGCEVAVLDLEVEEGKVEGGVKEYKCDVGDREQVEKVWSRLLVELGQPTILINNAAVVHGKRFQDLSMEDVERTFRTNTLAQYHLTSLFLPPLLTRPAGGTLITISSVLAHLGASHLSAYSGSKAALLAFHISLTVELASTPNIKTILVTPGQLDTGLFAGVQAGGGGGRGAGIGGMLAKFFGPVVEVQELALGLVAMIERGEGGVLAMPAYARWIAWMAVLPAGVQKVLRGWSGVDKAMEGFTAGKR